MKTKKRRAAERGGGTVFADMGLLHPEQERLKAGLTLQIDTILKERGLTQARAAKVLGIQQPRVSQLLRHRAGTFSMARLMELLTMLGCDVRIRIKPARKARGKMYLVV